MAYIGKTPQVGNYQKCDALTASATADYTLQVGSSNVSPESVNHMIVSLNGVIQSPTTAYTVSGATLSFASALTSNDTIDFILLLGSTLDIGTPSDGTISNAKLGTDVISGETDIGGAIADADLFLLDDGAGGTLRKTAASRIKTYIGGGITEFDSWRLNTTLAMSESSETLITANWERQDDATFDKIGTGMSESSGIFTFPSTGKYLLKLFANVTCSGNDTTRHARLKIFGTTDNSSYGVIASGNTNIASVTSGQDDNQVYCETLFDCTDTANRKVALYYQVADGSNIDSSTSFNAMSFNFMRLGDT